MRSFLQCIYDALLCTTSDAVDYVGDVACTGGAYILSIKDKIAGVVPKGQGGQPVAVEVPQPTVTYVPCIELQQAPPPPVCVPCPPPLTDFLNRSTILCLLRSSGGNFIRLAGISGVIAVAMGAYAAHVFYCRESEDAPHKKEIFETANRYHFIHSVALITCPLAKCPLLTGILLTCGITLFCGSCYIHALTDNKGVRRFTPYGGLMLIFGWISFIL